LKGVIELDWTVFENTLDLLGDLFGAKNAGVTGKHVICKGCSSGWLLLSRVGRKRDQNLIVQK
jgi:hypothetical protein